MLEKQTEDEKIKAVEFREYRIKNKKQLPVVYYESSKGSENCFEVTSGIPANIGEQELEDVFDKIRKKFKIEADKEYNAHIYVKLTFVSSGHMEQTWSDETEKALREKEKAKAKTL